MMTHDCIWMIGRAYSVLMPPKKHLNECDFLVRSVTQTFAFFPQLSSHCSERSPNTAAANGSDEELTDCHTLW